MVDFLDWSIGWSFRPQIVVNERCLTFPAIGVKMSLLVTM